MDLKLLRESTRPEHEATEAALPLMSPDLTRADYIAVLQRLHGVICAWDTVAAAGAPGAYAELVRQRRRCEAIEADLRFLGAPVAGKAPDLLVQQVRDLIADGGSAQHEERVSRFLGAMYVVEGSTLGGQYIAHHVEAGLKLLPGEGDRFFRGYGKETMPRWREFQQALLALPDAESVHVIAAAKAMFELFRLWMAQTLKPAESFAFAANDPRGGLANAS